MISSDRTTWVGRLFDAAVLVCAAALAFAALRPRAPEGAIKLSVDDWKRVSVGGIEFGSNHARVTIVEFIDYQCPVCARVEGILSQLEKEHPGQIRRIIRHFPITQLHPQAELAAISVECADSEKKTEQLHRLLLERQKEFTHVDFDTIGRAIDIGDERAFKACVNRQDSKRKVDEDRSLGNAIGVTGTPTLIVDRFLLSSVNPAALRSLVKAKLD